MAFYTIHPREIEEILREKRTLLIDVREREAYLEDHYGNARNCPYEEMDNWINRIPQNRVVLLYCDYGSTSLLAARRLGKVGVTAYTVIGGIHAIREYEQENERWNTPGARGGCGNKWNGNNRWMDKS